MKTLILGGVRSGKSRYAERLAIRLARQSQSKLVYIATSFPQDEEMRRRVHEHKQIRLASGENWVTVEETLHLADTLQKQAASSTTVVIDCLTLWMSNLLFHENACLMKAEVQKLLEVLPKLNGNLVFVSNEIGMGVVSMDRVTRQFIDEMGLLHQDLGKLCDQTDFIIAGQRFPLKKISQDDYG